MPQPQQCQNQAMYATYTTAHGNARSLTHWARPEIKPTTSWVLVGLVNHCATTGTPLSAILWADNNSAHFSFLFFFWSFCLFRTAPVVYGCSQARGWIGAIAASLRHSYRYQNQLAWSYPLLAHYYWCRCNDPSWRSDNLNIYRQNRFHFFSGE